MQKFFCVITYVILVLFSCRKNPIIEYSENITNTKYQRLQISHDIINPYHDCILSVNFKDDFKRIDSNIKKSWRDNSVKRNDVYLNSSITKTEKGVYFDGTEKGTLKDAISLTGNFTIYFTIEPEVTGKTILAKSSLPHYGFYYQGNTIYTSPGSQYSHIPAVENIINKVTTIAITRNITTGKVSLFLNGNFIDDFANNYHTRVFEIDQIAGEDKYLFKGWMRNLAIYTVQHSLETINLISNLLSPEKENLKLFLDAEKSYDGINIWNDISINNNHITFNNNSLPFDEKGIYFDGSEPGSLSKLITLDKDFTIYFTMTPTVDGKTLLGKSNLMHRYALWYNNNAIHCASTTNASVIYNAPNLVGSERHVAITRNASTGVSSLYIDGIFIDNFSVKSDFSTFEINQILGSDGYYFKGYIKKIHVYDILHDRRMIILNTSGENVQDDCMLYLDSKISFINNSNIWYDISLNSNHVRFKNNIQADERGIYFDGSESGSLSRLITLNKDFTLYFTITPTVDGKTLLGKSNLMHRYALWYNNNAIHCASTTNASVIYDAPNLVSSERRIAITRNANTGVSSLYIDGIFINNFSVKSDFSAFEINQILGSDGYYFKGYIKKVEIFKSLHDDQLIIQKTASVYIQDDCILYLDADKSYGSGKWIWYDMSNNKNHVKFTSDLQKTGNGFYFNGTEKGKLSQLISLDKDFTLYFTMTPTVDGKTLLGKSNLMHRYALWYNNNAIHCASTTNASVLYNAPSLIGVEKNVTITRNASTGIASLFIDGKYINNFSLSNNRSVFEIDQILGTDGYLFQGYIKKIQIYRSLHNIQTIARNINSNFLNSCELYLDADIGFSGNIWDNISRVGNMVTLNQNTTKNQDGIYFDGNTSAIINQPLRLNGSFTIYFTFKPEILNRGLLGNTNSPDYGIYFEDKDILTNINGVSSGIRTNGISANDVIVATITRNIKHNYRNTSLFLNGKKILTFPHNNDQDFIINNIVGSLGKFYKGWLKNLVIYSDLHDEETIYTMSKLLCPTPTEKYILIENNSTALPYTQDGNALVTINDAVYSMGGWDVSYGWENNVNNHIYKSTDLINWSKVNPVGNIWSGRHTFGAGIIEDRIYIYGADYQNSLIFGDRNRDVWATSDMINWTQLTSTAAFTNGGAGGNGRKRFLYGSCVFNNELYIIGGQSALKEGFPVTSIYKSRDGITWDSIANVAEFGINLSGQVVSYNDKIWVISGGYYQDGSNPIRTYTRKIFSSINGKIWKEEKSLPADITECQFGNTIVYDDKLWLLFGSNINIGGNSNLNEIRYMVSDGTWSKIENPYTIARHATGVTVFKDRIVFVCGNVWRDSWSILKI